MDKTAMHMSLCEGLSQDYMNILEITGDSYAKHRLEYGVTAFLLKADEVKDEIKMLVSKEVIDLSKQVELVEKLAQLCIMEMIEIQIKKGMRESI